MPAPRKTAALPKKRAATVLPKPTTLSPSASVIASRAYELFVRRGGAHGYDTEDWLAAERELLPDASAEG